VSQQGKSSGIEENSIVSEAGKEAAKKEIVKSCRKSHGNKIDSGREI